jgi:hypothetical protein
MLTTGVEVTVEDLLGALGRRWYVVLVGVLVTVVVCLFTLRAPGVYWASTKVYFLAPATVREPNQLAPDSTAAIAFAGLIQTEVHGGIPPRRSTSPDVSLVDEGIYDGWTIFLPDNGGQWASNFSEPALIVQASGATAEIVQSRMSAMVAQITQLVTDREDEAHVSAAARVTFTMSPTVVAVQYSNGHRSRALLIIGLLGIGLSLAACRIVDRVATSRRLRGETNDGIGDAGVRDATGGHQDGAGREGVGASQGSAPDRRGDGAASGDAGPGQRGVRDLPRP